ncbi:MAG TPA: hypothetical protein VK001_02890, partial [Geminicoccaceae bacterium]|nr:hypothetical protein [Geminicoccaceae bacterium]
MQAMASHARPPDSSEAEPVRPLPAKGLHQSRADRIAPRLTGHEEDLPGHRFLSRQSIASLPSARMRS